MTDSVIVNKRGNWDSIINVSDIHHKKSSESGLLQESFLGDYLFGYETGAKNVSREYRRYTAFRFTIINELNEYGIPSDFCGFSYIADAILIIIDYNSYNFTLINDIYPAIKMKYKLRSSDIVEHNIRNAINKAYMMNASRPGINKMIFFERKPGNKKFLIHITERVIRKMRVWL
jgi:hypothetical protein